MAELKTLRVCLSSELPILLERKPNFIYFIYDKLELFVGQTMYSDPFAIVESMPENPVSGMLYLVLDGYIRIYLDYGIKEIAYIESEDQLELLKQAGTTFFVNSEKRYLDLQRRVITLPFNNGTYELTVSLAKDLIIDKDTVIGFNPLTNQFEIIGNHNTDLVFTGRYRGKDSDSVNMTVSENKISADVKVSKGYDNIIKILPDGIYANANNKVDKDTFYSWVENYHNYRTSLNYYLRDLETELDNMVGIDITEEYIFSKIRSAIQSIIPDIEEAIEKYDEILAKFEAVETNTKAYTDEKFTMTKQEIIDYINSKSTTENIWETF